MSVEHDDRTRPFPPPCQPLAVPLLGQPVADAERRSDVRSTPLDPRSRTCPPGTVRWRTGRVGWSPGSPLDPPRDAGRRQHHVARVRADAHVEIADRDGKQVRQSARDGRLSCAIGADQCDRRHGRAIAGRTASKSSWMSTGYGWVTTHAGRPAKIAWSSSRCVVSNVAMCSLWIPGCA